MPRNTAIACLTFLLATAPASATPVQFALTPASVKLGFRAYGLGFVRIDGQFTHFTGTLSLDQADPTHCTLQIHAESASLEMPQKAMTEDALGPDLLDVTRFPDFRIEGRCQHGQLHGTLLLHGITRPITLDILIENGQWQASGLIHRADWGMSARPLLAGPEVRVSVMAGLPPSFQQ